MHIQRLHTRNRKQKDPATTTWLAFSSAAKPSYAIGYTLIEYVTGLAWDFGRPKVANLTAADFAGGKDLLVVSSVREEK
jgi:hypothetical protein